MGTHGDALLQNAGHLGFTVRRVPLDAPWDWLGRGWRDLCTVPFVSLSYGAVFSLAAWGILFGLRLLDAVSLIPVLAGGFMLVGPIFAAGLYEASRRLETGERITLRQAFGAGWQATGRLGFFGVVLFFAFFVWVQLAFLLLMLFLGLGGATLPPPNEYVQSLLFTRAGLGLLFTGTLTGAALAMIVFSISAVAPPLLLVEKVDAVTAMTTSMRTVRLNLGPMLLWAALIAGSMLLGFATLFLGLLIAFPLVGHATWHAFRALVVLDNH
jgi:uncharacterized membrane protein